MITVYAGTDDTVKFTIIDATGVAVNLSLYTASVIIEDVGEYDIAGDSTGIGYATVTGTDTDGLSGLYRYWTYVDGKVAEEGVLAIRAADAAESVS